MNKALLKGVFCFSLLFNLALAGTLSWYWVADYFHWYAPAAEQSLEESELIQLRKMWDEHRENTREIRKNVQDKKGEMVDLIASNPIDRTSAENKVKELVLLEGQLDREIFITLSQMMASLPPEKRPAFLNFLKQRARGAQGMGFRRDHQRCPAAIGSPGPDSSHSRDRSGGGSDRR